MSRDPKGEVILIAKAMLQGADALESCRRIAALRGHLPNALQADVNLLVFVAVESEMDDMPSLAERALWSAEALAEQDRAGEIYLAQARAELFRAASSLIAKWER